MLILLMKIMPFYKMLALATATNSIFSTCLLQNHKEWPVCTKHGITHFVVEIGTGILARVLKTLNGFQGEADGEGMTHFRTQRGACRLATHPTISWGRKKGTKGKKTKSLCPVLCKEFMVHCHAPMQTCSATVAISLKKHIKLTEYVRSGALGSHSMLK